MKAEGRGSACFLSVYPPVHQYIIHPSIPEHLGEHLRLQIIIVEKKNLSSVSISVLGIIQEEKRVSCFNDPGVFIPSSASFSPLLPSIMVVV